MIKWKRKRQPMRIDNLEEYVQENGNELRSYRHLCEVLGVSPKGGNQKKAQVKEIERYIKLSKGKGYKLIVDEVYELPKPKKTNRRNDIYGEMLELAIMDYLINSKRSKTTTTRNYLLGQVELINQNYRVCNSNKIKFSEYTGIDLNIINDFFNLTNGNFRRMLERALDTLEDKSIINYSIVTIVSDSKTGHRKATDKELESIVELEKIVLNELGYNKKSSVRESGKWYIFNQRVKKLLSKENDINYYYSSYEIVVNKRFIKDERDKVEQYLISEAERVANRDKLTDTLSDNLISNASDRQKKARSNTNINRINKQTRNTFTYVEDIQSIVNHVISPYSGRIIEAVINVDQ